MTPDLGTPTTIRNLISHLKGLISEYLTVTTCHYSCYEIGHTWTPYCRQALLDVIISSFKYALKIYTVLYTVTAIVKRRPVSYFLNSLWKEILRSTAFLTTNAWAFMATFCLWRAVLGKCDSSCAFLPALVASAMAILVERKSRHGLLSLYTTNLALETLYNTLKSRGVITPVPLGEVLLFSFSIAGFLYLYGKNALDSGTNSVFRVIFGSSEAGKSEENIVPAGAINLLPLALRRVVERVLSFRLLRARHDSCRHAAGCVLVTLQRYARGFCVGYALNSLIRVPGLLTSLFRQPSILLRWLLSPESAGCGAFIAGLAALHQAVCCTARWLRGGPSDLDTAIGGAIAGLSMVQYRSPVVALYVFVRLIDVICRKLSAENKIPNMRYGYSCLYAVSTAYLFHTAFWEPHNIRAAYWRFMLSITGNRFSEMNRQLLDRIFGTKGATLYPDFWPTYDPRFTSLGTSLAS